MFRGNHPARVDEKGRLKVPAEFKRQVDEKYGAEFYITSRDGKVAESYPVEEWRRIAEKLPQGGGHGQAGHVSVLLKEAIDFLAVRRGGTYTDATLGLGGHSYEIARRLGPQGHLIGFDKDPQALQIAQRRLSKPPEEMKSEWPQQTLVHASFAELQQRISPASADGILADLV